MTDEKNPIVNAICDTYTNGYKRALEDLGLKEKPKYRIGQTVYVPESDNACVIDEMEINISTEEDDCYNRYIIHINMERLNYREDYIFNSKNIAWAKERREYLNLSKTLLQKKLGDERYQKIEEQKAPKICGFPADELDEADLLIALKLIGTDFDFKEETNDL